LKRFKGLVIENFQSHERTEIAFSEGLNVFVGPSDSGKSAILRALRWVLYNQPRGSDFIRTGASRCRVTLILSDGTHIVRERSSSVNRYLIRDPEGKERIFEGFGSDVPREVLEAHGMIPLQLDEDRELTLQIAQQLEGPFLLSESGGTRARSIGRISGAHLLDLAQNETARDQRSVSSRIRFVEEEMKRREEELKPYEVLPRFREQLNRAAALREEAGRKMELLERLRGLKERWEDCRSEMTRERRRLVSLSKVPEAEKIFSRLMEDGARLSRIRKRADDWRRGREEKAHWQMVRFRTTRLGKGRNGLPKPSGCLSGGTGCGACGTIGSISSGRWTGSAAWSNGRFPFPRRASWWMTSGMRCSSFENWSGEKSTGSTRKESARRSNARCGGWKGCRRRRPCGKVPRRPAGCTRRWWIGENGFWSCGNGSKRGCVT